MDTADKLVSGTNAWCFAKPGEVYAVYLFGDSETKLQIPKGDFTKHWYDTRNGGALIPAEPVTGPGEIALGTPPHDPDKDWVVLVRRKK